MEHCMACLVYYLCFPCAWLKVTTDVAVQDRKGISYFLALHRLSFLTPQGIELLFSNPVMHVLLNFHLMLTAVSLHKIPSTNVNARGNKFTNRFVLSLLFVR